MLIIDAEFDQLPYWEPLRHFTAVPSEMKGSYFLARYRNTYSLVCTHRVLLKFKKTKGQMAMAGLRL